MLTLSYGFKKPQTGDKGSVFFPALETNFQLLNDHNHDGVTSVAVSTTAITKGSQTISSGSWIATTGGTYRQEVTMPAGFSYAGSQIRFRISSGTHEGATIFPSIEKGSAANKYYVYTNDNSLDIEALYV